MGRKDNRRKNRQQKQQIALHYEEVYECPACGHGELSAIALMDVFSCDFCRHMFTANLQTQSVHLADSLQPMAWTWTGWRWRGIHQQETAAGLVWGFAAVLTIAPVALIALSNYVFPPMGGWNFVFTWLGLTWLSHSLIAGWLLAEYHRWPWYVSGRIRLQRWREQWAT